MIQCNFIKKLPREYSSTPQKKCFCFFHFQLDQRGKSPIYCLKIQKIKNNKIYQRIIQFEFAMQVDINQPKSKAFNIFLRLLQLGLQLSLGYWALQKDGIFNCNFDIANLTSYASYALVLLALISLITIRCSSTFPRCCFFLSFIFGLIIMLGIVALNAVKGYSNCSSSKLFYQFAIIQPSIGIIITFVILFMRFAWAQRYTNSPGNIVWVILFLPFEWPTSVKIYMIIIGIGSGIVSILSLLLNIPTLVKTSTTTRKILLVGWMFGFIFSLIYEGLAIFKYLNFGPSNQYEQDHAKRTLALFIAVNGIDIIFWLFGKKSLEYEKGDNIRDSLFTQNQELFQPKNVHMDNSIVVSQNIGTLAN